MTLAIFIVFLGFLVWGIKSGQFRNVEEAKYQVFRKQRPSGREGEKPGNGQKGEDESNNGS